MISILIVASVPRSLLNFRGQLIDLMMQKGFKVDVAAPGLISSPYAMILEKKGCSVHDIALQRTGLNPIADWKALVSLYRLMRVVKPTHILAYTIKPVIYGLLAAGFARIPHRYSLITGLGYAFTENSGFLQKIVKRISRCLYGAALKSSDCVFFQNPDDEKLFRELRILPSTTTSKIINGSGIDLRSFSPVALPDKPVFLLIARLLGNKGVREYAAAANIILKSYPDVSFQIVGWIDDSPDAITGTELSSWIESGIIYLGKLDDVRPAIAKSSVYVLPSYREGTPRTVLEAMAMARPVITTDAPGCRETVVHGYNGYLVKPKSVQSIVEAMEKFIVDNTLAVRMGKASRLIAEEKYDVHKVNLEILAGMGLFNS